MLKDSGTSSIFAKVSSMSQSMTLRIMPPSMSVWKKGVLFFFFLLLLFAFIGGLWALNTNKCNMGENLGHLLVRIATTLNRNAIPFWLEYGTLLGAYRDHGIIPWDFDIDLGSTPQGCDAISALKSTFLEVDCVVYNRTDYIAEKAAWGFGPYIQTPCIRIADRNHLNYYADVYDFATMTPTEARANKLFVPSGYKWNEDLLCSKDGWTGEVEAGCRTRSSMLPLQSLSVYNTPMPIPADPVINLHDMFGPEWSIPRPRNYKAILCNSVLLFGYPFVYLSLLLLFVGSTFLIILLAFGLYLRSDFRRRQLSPFVFNLQS
eukprot:TRINITY_DN2264_c0_g1_i1.p1 TRINITY_DN2264_c0_g1~~TRINITY_DN2264_c0_g1_i1.p1  ORF type:complete len:319 (-),score=26.12 TRINITY_DN2264_c0_g1_i1:49-1005(-)